MHRPLLRLSREAKRSMGHRPTAADLRKRSNGSGRAVATPDARCDGAHEVPRGLSTPRLSPNAERVHGEGWATWTAGAGSRRAVRGRAGVARGIEEARYASVMQNARFKMQNRKLGRFAARFLLHFAFCILNY